MFNICIYIFNLSQMCTYNVNYYALLIMFLCSHKYWEIYGKFLILSASQGHIDIIAI